MAADRLLVVAFTRCNDPARTEDWAVWYDETHLPDLLRAGADVAARFELTAKPVPGMPSVGFSHVTLYEFSGVGAARRLEAVAARDEDLRRAGGVHPNHAVMGVDVVRSHGRFNEKCAPGPDLVGHILAYVMANQPNLEAEWDAWYEDTHLPDMLASGAFAAGSRWLRRVPAPYGANHLTLYDIANRSIESAVAASAAVMPAIAAAGRKHPAHVAGLVITVRGSGSFGGRGLRRSDL